MDFFPRFSSLCTIYKKRFSLQISSMEQPSCSDLSGSSGLLRAHPGSCVTHWPENNEVSGKTNVYVAVRVSTNCLKFKHVWQPICIFFLCIINAYEIITDDT